jgi:transcription initiation factor TFIID subunit 7
LKKLTADLEMKLAQRHEMKEKQRMKKEGIAPDDNDPDGGGNDHDEGDGEVDVDVEADLFGTDGPSGMDMDIS